MIKLEFSISHHKFCTIRFTILKIIYKYLTKEKLQHYFSDESLHHIFRYQFDTL